jgi:hypothetical protein
VKVTCSRTGKATFGERETAMMAATRATRRVDYLRVYRCEFCGFWHLTTKPLDRAKLRGGRA